MGLPAERKPGLDKPNQKVLDALEELEAISAYDKAKADADEIIPFEQAIAEIESRRDEL